MRRSIMDDKHKRAVALPAPGVGQSGAAPNLARRSFIIAAPLGVLVAVAAGAASAVPAVTPATPDRARKRGYHETEHIHRYYQTAAYW